MERLEPVLKQKFWILLGIAVLMTFIGWYSATTGMAKTITERKSSIDKSFSDVPKGDIPNETWSHRLGQINSEQDATIKVTQLMMWKRQRAVMTWPEGLVENGYMAKFKNQDRETFRATYLDEITRIWKLVNPMTPEGTGIVKYDRLAFFQALKQRPFLAAPSSEVMWTVREDMWLFEALFQSITALNGGFEASRADAIIHQIDKLELRGGGEFPAAAAGGGGAVAQSGFGGLPGGAPMGAPGIGVPPMGGPGRSGALPIAAGLKPISAEFDPVEEFGDDGSGSAGSNRATMGLSLLGASGGMSEAAPAEAKQVNRYVTDNPKLPYKTRGFYLSVKMDHTKIPLLIAELTSNEKSVWPIEIKRIQMSRLNEDDSPGMSRSPTGGGGGSSSASRMRSMPIEASSSAASSLSGAGELDNLNPFEEVDETAPMDFSQRVEVANAALANALRDPAMAQVTICGIITLYREVKEPEAKKPAEAPATAPATTSEETVESGANPATGEASATSKVPASETDESATSAPKEAVASGERSEPAKEPSAEDPNPSTGETESMEKTDSSESKTENNKQ